MVDSNSQKAIRRNRTDDRSAGDLVAYQDENGDAIALTGDEDAPYAHALGRVSDDGLSPVTALEGEAQRLLVDEQGRLWTRNSGAPSSNGGSLSAMSTKLEEYLTVKSGAGSVSDVRMLVTTGVVAARWLMLFDSTGAPAAGAAPIWQALLPNPGAAAAEVSESFSAPIAFTTGLVLAISTTQLTYTSPGADEAMFSAIYL